MCIFKTTEEGEDKSSAFHHKAAWYRPGSPQRQLILLVSTAGHVMIGAPAITT